MSNRIDHKAKAEAIARRAADDPYIPIAESYAGMLHATLYLAEQQRIANLIAYHAAGMHKGAIDGPGLPGPHEQARKALGL